MGWLLSTTLKNLAKELGLSVSTVSRIMNGKGKFPEKTKNRVLDMANKLGYTPNIYARSLREQEYHVMGLIVPNVINPFFGTILQATEEECRKIGYTLLSGVSGYSKERETEYINYLASNQVNGVILVSHDSEDEIREMHYRGMQVISLNEHGKNEEIDWVSIDSHAAMMDLTQYLINQGHKDIACVYGLDEFYISETESNRLSGYMDCMKKNGLPVDDNKVIGTYENFEAAKREAQKLLCLSQLPSAVVCHNNEIAAGVYEAAIEAGYSVPKDISIACFDSILPDNIVGVQFTSILQPLEDISSIAVNMIANGDLTEDINRERKRINLPYSLRMGTTTAPRN